MKCAPMLVEPTLLEGRHIRLEPLSLAHLDRLWEVASDQELWRWMPAQVHTAEALRIYIEEALTGQTQGTTLPFATVERAGGRVIGSTRYGNMDRAHRRVEIGWTWLGREWQRTAANTEAKYLMLHHAFETLGCVRVELKTDALNDRSRKAILRLGAREEGTFRHHMITSSGRVRDTVYYSILEGEWPEVKRELNAKLAHR